MSEQCSYVYDDKQQCPADADWEFYTQGQEDLRFISCDTHLPYMLESGMVSTVYPYDLER